MDSEPFKEASWLEVRDKLGVPDEVPPDLLAQAFMHPSYAREADLAPEASNQRLEFVGDAVLGLVLAQYLYEQDETAPEGDLTKRKAFAVRRAALARVARRLGLGEHILLGRGEDDSGGRRKASILGDCLEALIGAIYLSAGHEKARDYVLDVFSRVLEQAGLQAPQFDYKTALQELLQKHIHRTPSYQTVRAFGPPHDRTFTVEASIGETTLGQGTGGSKQQAEQQAAKQALEEKDSWLPQIAAGGEKQ